MNESRDLRAVTLVTRNEPRHTRECTMSHIWMSQVTHMNESCHIWMSQVTYGWVMSHMNESHDVHFSKCKSQCRTYKPRKSMRIHSSRGSQRKDFGKWLTLWKVTHILKSVSRACKSLSSERAPQSLRVSRGKSTTNRACKSTHTRSFLDLHAAIVVLFPRLTRKRLWCSFRGKRLTRTTYTFQSVSHFSKSFL